MDSRLTSVSHYVAGQFHVMWWIDTVLQCVDRQCFLSSGWTRFLIMWMDNVSYHVDEQCFMSCGQAVFHVMWLDCVSCHVDRHCFISYGQCFMSCGWTVFYVMWMDTVWPHLDEQNVSHHSDINRNVHHLDEWSFSSFERTVFHSILDEQCFTLSLLAVFVIYIIWLQDRYFTARCSWCHASEQCFTSAEHCFISEWLPCHITWERAWKVFHNLQMSSIWRNLVNTVSVTQSISHWWTLSV